MRGAHPTDGRLWRVSFVTALGVAVLLLAACGGRPAEVVARIGRVSITEPLLDHWAYAIARRTTTGKAQGDDRTPRQRALDYLISAQWVLGEAARRGLQISGDEVRGQLLEQQASFATGREYEASLKQTGRTSADARFEVALELTIAKLSKAVEDEAPKSTEAQVQAYYVRHRREFAYPERRAFELVEDLASKGDAMRLLREIGHRRSFGKLAFKETFDRPARFVSGDKGSLVRAIFAAKIGVPHPPMPFFGRFAFFEVKRIFPAGSQALKHVSGVIKARLQGTQRREAVARFLRSWRARWRARTICRPGFVIERCRDYAGALAPNKSLVSEPVPGG